MVDNQHLGAGRVDGYGSANESGGAYVRLPPADDVECPSIVKSVGRRSERPVESAASTYWAEIIFVVRTLVVRPFQDREQHWTAVSIVLLLCFAIGTEVTSALIMSTNGEFYRSITSADKSMFLTNLCWALLVVSAVGIQKAGQLVLKEVCALLWRKTLVQEQSKNYFAHRAYYRCSLDNPDQRMSQDTDRLTVACSELLAGAIITPGIIVYYTAKLMVMFDWVVPTACFVFFLLGSLVNWVCVRRVVPFVTKQEHLEGDFRFNLFWFRSHAESVAFYDEYPSSKKSTAVSNDRDRMMERFDRVVANQRDIIKLHVPLYTCSKLFDYLGAIVSYGALGGFLLYVSSSTSSTDASAIAERVSKGTFATLYLISAFTGLFDLGNYASQVVGYSRRVRPMLATFVQTKTPVVTQHPLPVFKLPTQVELTRSLPPPNVESKVLMSLKNVAISLPAPNSNAWVSPDAEDDDTQGYSGPLLLESIDLEIVQGKNTLIIGPSGIGKTSLIRTMAQLWPPLRGSVVSMVTPVFVVPQEPYIFAGSFQELVLYGVSHGQARSLSAERKTLVMSLLNLGRVVERCANDWTVAYDWPMELSRGEQQRVALARVFFERPELVLLDEATSAVSERMAQAVYEQLKADNITIVTVCHHTQGIAKYHHNGLEIVRTARSSARLCTFRLNEQDGE